MNDRKTMGSNPVEEILSESSGNSENNTRTSQEQSKENGETKVKKRVTVSIPEALAERLRNCVFWTAGDITMTRIATEGIREALEAIEEERNDGDKYPDRDRELKGGRPVE